MRFAASCEIEPEEHARPSSSAATAGSRPPTTACPAVEVLDADRRRRPLAADELERCGSGPDAALGQGDRRPGPAGRGRPRRDARRLHEGLLPGPGAGRAAPPPRHANRGLRVLEIDAASCRPTTRRSTRRQGRRPRHERRPERSPTDPCSARLPLRLELSGDGPADLRVEGRAPGSSTRPDEAGGAKPAPSDRRRRSSPSIALRATRRRVSIEGSGDRGAARGRGAP